MLKISEDQEVNPIVEITPVDKDIPNIVCCRYKLMYDITTGSVGLSVSNLQEEKIIWIDLDTLQHLTDDLIRTLVVLGSSEEPLPFVAVTTQ